MGEACTKSLLGIVAGIADFKYVWKTDPLKMFEANEVSSIEITRNPPLAYLTQWKQSRGVKGTRKLLVTALVDAEQADLASKICKKIAKEKSGEFFIFL